MRRLQARRQKTEGRFIELKNTRAFSFRIRETVRNQPAGNTILHIRTGFVAGYLITGRSKYMKGHCRRSCLTVCTGHDDSGRVT